MTLFPPAVSSHGRRHRRHRAPSFTAALAAGTAAIVLGACGASSAASDSPTVSASVGAKAGAMPMGNGMIGPARTQRKAPVYRQPVAPGVTTTTVGSATVGPVNVPPPPPVTTLPPAGSGSVTFVGDSVGVDATPYLQQDIPGINCNAMVDRSWGVGETILQGLAAQGALGSIVVVELGLNGPIADSDFQQMMSILSGVKRVVFLNIHLPVGAYGPGTDWWQNQNNQVLATEVPKYPNALLADWYSISEGHSDYFAPDGIHLDPPGAAAMAALVRQYA
jgi:hypothetical protein